MADTTNVVRLRVLLCFLKLDAEDCTVTGIAKILNVEKYVVSRALALLEKEGCINRENVRNPILTEKGHRIATYYAERLEITLNHLLYEGVDIENAKKDAFNWALSCSDKTMEVIRATEERYRVKYELREQKQFSGATLCKKLKDGCYQFPFLICREQVKNGSNLSMANEGFVHPCDLCVENGVGMIRLRAKPILAKSPVTGKSMRTQAVKVKYFDMDRYISAESNGQIFSFPAEALHFVNVGAGFSTGQVLYGSVLIQIECSCDEMEMPTSAAIFTILI